MHISRAPSSRGRGANRRYTHKKLDGKGERERFVRHFRALADGRQVRKAAGRITTDDDKFSGVAGYSVPAYPGDGSDFSDGEGGTIVALECTRAAGKEFAEAGKMLLESILKNHAKATREAARKVYRPMPLAPLARPTHMHMCMRAGRPR